MAGFECCFNCVAPKRYPGCSAECHEYKAAKDENAKKKAYLEPHIADKYMCASSEKHANVKRIEDKTRRQRLGKAGCGHK